MFIDDVDLDSGFAMSEVSLVSEIALILRSLMNQGLNGSQVVRQAQFQLPRASSLVVQSLMVLQQLSVMTLKHNRLADLSWQNQSIRPQ